MSKLAKIHQGKQPIRRHFLAEWLEARGMTVADLLEKLNDPERPMALKEVDKSQAYRWLKGQMPQPQMQKRIADCLDMEDPAQLLRNPADDWLARFFDDKTEEQKEDAIKMLKLLFKDDKTGTNG